MTDEKKKRNKTEKTTEAPSFSNHPALEKAEEKPNERLPGPKGEVGQGSPATKLKRLWHEAQFVRTDANKDNQRKKFWKANRNALSLKEFVQTLLKDETHGALAKKWLDSKLGKFDQERSENSKKRIALERSATKLAKKSKGKAQKAKPSATT